ncbi:MULTISPECIES: hypothetical protein [unclassified Coleofasciculus]|uniref:hypothetical protein n=1 Tax=unclassified Coleofasciculus TaxID=2692782 RepID=UPI00187E5A18|nr:MULTISPECIES: hypothetical protein [unclassified Coleofasciculus]MBE9127237.1 hypothetical protein [Coleofasciculus sp. LEGE 07081]MBE9150611.1 hypothetical protein [Coleofasciculus sp. LEGE 07092]
MALTRKARLWEIGNTSSRLSQLFAETMKQGQISSSDWYDVITAPLDNSFSVDHEDAITRMIYGVRHGFVKVV